MSIHPTLKVRSKVAPKRNVLKRYERIDIMKNQGKFEEGRKVWGIPKTRVR